MFSSAGAAAISVVSVAASNSELCCEVGLGCASSEGVCCSLTEEVEVADWFAGGCVAPAFKARKKVYLVPCSRT